MTPLFSVDQVRALDRYAIESLTIPGIELMTRAGAAALRILRQRYPQARSLAVYCGAGNNGGDGYVLARLAGKQGFTVRTYAVFGRPPQHGEAVLAWQAYCDSGGELSTLESVEEDVDVRVDAVFGTGLTRAPDASLQALFDAINASSVPVLSLDVPSGLCADTGSAFGRPLKASLTVSFIAHKRGLFTAVAPRYSGEILLDSLDLPATLLATQTSQIWSADRSDIHAGLPPRDPCAHKGDHGHVLVIGGDHGMGGAARLAAEAAARAGAGWVSVATRSKHLGAMLAARPELMVRAVDSDDELQPLLQKATLLALGPGLGQQHWGRALMDAALASGKPAVIDADALNLLAESPRRLGAQYVLTPHPGEAARLLGCDTATVQADRFAALTRLVQRYDCCVVLKGNGTLSAAPGTPVLLCRGGNPGMASAGMGDVLCGLIAGLYAQGLALHAPIGDGCWSQVLGSAALGVELHARCADHLAGRGMRGMLAGDLPGLLPEMINP